MKPGFKEVDIEDFIWNAIPSGTLEKRGLHLPRGIYYRQMNLLGCGVMDIIGIRVGKDIYDFDTYPFVSIIIYELKRHQITCNDLGQLSRYFDTIALNSRKLAEIFEIPDHYIFKIEGVLIGSGIERDAYHTLMLLGVDRVRAMEYEISFEHGIVFNEINGYAQLPDISFREVPQINHRRAMRASYPLRADHRPRQKSAIIGESATDTQNAVPSPF